MRWKILGLLLLAFSLSGATYAWNGQAPEGLTSSTANFSRVFGDFRSTVVIAPDSAYVEVVFTPNGPGSVNDTIRVEAGDVLNYSPNGGILSFTVIRTSATKCWNMWYK